MLHQIFAIITLISLVFLVNSNIILDKTNPNFYFITFNETINTSSDKSDGQKSVNNRNTDDNYEYYYDSYSVSEEYTNIIDNDYYYESTYYTDSEVNNDNNNDDSSSQTIMNANTDNYENEDTSNADSDSDNNESGNTNKESNSDISENESTNDPLSTDDNNQTTNIYKSFGNNTSTIPESKYYPLKFKEHYNLNNDIENESTDTTYATMKINNDYYAALTIELNIMSLYIKSYKDIKIQHGFPNNVSPESTILASLCNNDGIQENNYTNFVLFYSPLAKTNGQYLKYSSSEIKAIGYNKTGGISISVKTIININKNSSNYSINSLSTMELSKNLIVVVYKYYIISSNSVIAYAVLLDSKLDYVSQTPLVLTKTDTFFISELKLIKLSPYSFAVTWANDNKIYYSIVDDNVVTDCEEVLFDNHPSSQQYSITSLFNYSVNKKYNFTYKLDFIAFYSDMDLNLKYSRVCFKDCALEQENSSEDTDSNDDITYDSDDDSDYSNIYDSDDYDEDDTKDTDSYDDTKDENESNYSDSSESSFHRILENSKNNSNLRTPLQKANNKKIIINTSQINLISYNNNRINKESKKRKLQNKEEEKYSVKYSNIDTKIMTAPNNTTSIAILITDKDGTYLGILGLNGQIDYFPVLILNSNIYNANIAVFDEKDDTNNNTSNDTNDTTSDTDDIGIGIFWKEVEDSKIMVRAEIYTIDFSSWSRNTEYVINIEDTPVYYNSTECLGYYIFSNKNCIRECSLAESTSIYVNEISSTVCVECEYQFDMCLSCNQTQCLSCNENYYLSSNYCYQSSDTSSSLANQSSGEDYDDGTKGSDEVILSKKTTIYIVVCVVVLLLIGIFGFLFCYLKNKYSKQQNNVNNVININIRHSNVINSNNNSTGNNNNNLNNDAEMLNIRNNSNSNSNSSNNNANNNTDSNNIKDDVKNNNSSNIIDSPKCVICLINNSTHYLLPCNCKVCFDCGNPLVKNEEDCSNCEKQCTGIQTFKPKSLSNIDICNICKEKPNIITLNCGNKHKVCKKCYQEMKKRNLPCHMCRNIINYSGNKL